MCDINALKEPGTHMFSLWSIMHIEHFDMEHFDNVFFFFK